MGVVAIAVAGTAELDGVERSASAVESRPVISVMGGLDTGSCARQRAGESPNAARTLDGDAAAVVLYDVNIQK